MLGLISIDVAIAALAPAESGKPMQALRNSKRDKQRRKEELKSEGGSSLFDKKIRCANFRHMSLSICSTVAPKKKSKVLST